MVCTTGTDNPVLFGLSLSGAKPGEVCPKWDGPRLGRHHLNHLCIPQQRAATWGYRNDQQLLLTHSLQQWKDEMEGSVKHCSWPWQVRHPPTGGDCRVVPLKTIVAMGAVSAGEQIHSCFPESISASLRRDKASTCLAGDHPPNMKSVPLFSRPGT